MSYKKNIASNFITQIIGLILGFVTSILIARALGPEGKGYLAYFLLIIGLINSINGKEKKLPIIGDLADQWFKNL